MFKLTLPFISVNWSKDFRKAVSEEPGMFLRKLSQTWNTSVVYKKEKFSGEANQYPEANNALISKGLSTLPQERQVVVNNLSSYLPENRYKYLFWFN